MQPQLITPELVALDVDFGSTPREVIEHLAALIVDAGRATDASTLTEAAAAREEKAGTGVNGRVAIPPLPHLCSGSADPRLRPSRLPR